MENNITKPDLSWMWRVSEDSSKIIDFNDLIKDPDLAQSLTNASASGFRFALRKLEELNIISINDINKVASAEDIALWDKE